MISQARISLQTICCTISTKLKLYVKIIILKVYFRTFLIPNILKPLLQNWTDQANRRSVYSLWTETVLYRDRILGRNFLLAIHSHLCYWFSSPPPRALSKSGFKLCNLSSVYWNIMSENSQDYAQKPQRNWRSWIWFQFSVWRQNLSPDHMLHNFRVSQIKTLFEHIQKKDIFPNLSWTLKTK